MKDFSISTVAEIALGVTIAGVIMIFLTPLLAKHFEESFED